MEKGLAIRRRLHSFLYKNLFRIVSALFVFTMVSVWLTCGLFAKYATSDSGSDFATVAKIGGIEVYEHKAELISTTEEQIKANSLYELNKTAKVVSNTYDTVLPGMTIQKDPTIEIDGSSDVACEVYLEVVDSSKDNLIYSLSSEWTEVTDVTPIHTGGKLYKYNNAISVHEQKTIKGIISGDSVQVKDKLVDVSSTLPDTFSLDFYAYLVQLD